MTAQKMARVCFACTLDVTHKRIEFRSYPNAFKHVDADLLAIAKARNEKPPEPSNAIFDAVGEATNIVLGASRIDWNRESACDTERAVRRKYIERHICEHGLHLSGVHFSLMALRMSQIPSDLAKTLSVLKIASDEIISRKEAKELHEIQREVIFGEAQPNDEEVPVADDLQQIDEALNPVDPEELIRRIFGE